MGRSGGPLPAVETGLLSERWLHLTAATVLTHLSLHLVLLLALRHMGVSEAQVATCGGRRVTAVARYSLRSGLRVPI